MKRSNTQTIIDALRVLELINSVYLTPAQARRIAAHLVKLAEMREKESKQ